MAINGQDIGLLFGVLGGGSISGESGKLIREQLDGIVSSLNNDTNSKRRRIKLTLDIAGTKRDFTEGLKQITNGLSGQKQFKIKVSEIDATSAINKLKGQLESMLKTLSVKSGMTITMPLASGGSIVGDAGTQVLNEATQKAAEFAAQLTSIKTISQSVTSAVKGAVSGNNAITDSEALTRVINDYTLWLQKIEELKSSKATLSSESLAALQAEGVAITENIAAIRQKQRAQESADTAAKNSASDYASRLSRLNSLQKIVTTALGYTNAKHTEQYRAIEAANSELREMATNYSLLTNSNLDRLEAQIKNSTAQIRSMGLASKSLGDTLLSNAKKFTSWLGVSQLIMTAYNSLRKMVVAVRDVDTAMTELKKVTEETDTTYANYLENAISRAKELGATVADTVTASADFARLGYTLDEAAALADAALVYKNVGDGIEDISTASESIISTMKAFNIEAENAMLIVDKFNEVGNNFAISSKGVGDALLRSASALASGNNSLDESIALITAANNVVQDADKVGTTLKTISMYLRAAKTEAEDAGESTDGMANSVSELREELLALTGGKVDIQLDEDTFKSTYQIIKELSEVWGELTDITQANILEMIGGKRNSNVVAALLTNFQTAEDVLKTSAEAAGSALAENEKYLDSINGKIDMFKATFEELSLNVFDSELIKGAIDFGTALLDVLNTLADINALLPVTVALITTIMALRRAERAGALASGIVNALTAGLSVENEEVKSLAAAYSLLTASRQKDVIAIVSARLSQQGLNQEQIAAKLATIGLTGATNSQTAANYGLAASFKAVMLSNPVGWVLMAISIIPSLISLIGSLHKSNEELIQDAEDLRTSYSESFSELSTDLSTLRGLEDEFYKLSDGVDEYGNNVSLAADDYERYQEIVSTILGISPSLISGYDAEGNAIANKNGLLERSIELMEEEQRLKMREYVSDDNLGTLLKGERANLEETLKDIEIPETIGWSGVKVLDDGSLEYGYVNNIADYIEDAIGVAFNYEGIDTYIQNNADIIEERIGEILNNASKDFTDENGNTWKALTDSQIADMESYILSITNAVQQSSSTINQSLQYIPQTLSAYGDLTDGQKDFLTQYINSFKITADTTEQDILQMKQDILDFTDFIASNDTLKETIDLGLSIKYGVNEDGNSLTVSDYKERIAELNRQIDSYDEDLQVNIKAALGIETDASEINTEVEEAITHVKNLLAEPFEKEELSVLLEDYQEELRLAQEASADLSKTVYGNIDTNNRQIIEWNESTLTQFKDAIMSWEDQNAQWDDVKKSLDGSFSTLYGSSNNFDGVEIAFSPILQTEDGPILLSSDTLDEYIYGLIDKAGEGWSTETLLALDAEGLEFDGITIKNMIADIGDTAIETGEAMHYVGDLGSVNIAYENLADAAESAGISVDELNTSIENGNFDNLQTVEDIINNLPIDDVLRIYYNISADPNSMTIDELKSELEMLGVDWSNTVDVWDFSTMVDGLEDIESSVGSLVSAMSTLRDGTKLTKGELAKLALEYPELLKVSDLFTDTSIQNQQAMLDAVLGTYESEYDALIDTKIAELEATNQLIQDQIALENEKKNKVIEIADLQSNGKIDSERSYQELLDELHDLEGQNYVTYSDGVLSVNQDMLQKELEQTADKVEETRPLFEAQGDLIAEANYKGTSEGLKAFPQYASKLANWAGTSFKTLLGNIGTNIGKAFKGETDFVGLLDGIGGIGDIKTNGITLETEIESKYTIDGKSVDDWSADYKETIEKRVETLTEQIEANNTIIDNLTKLKGLDLTSIYGSDSGSRSSNSKEVEEYIADIERYREALERLSQLRIIKEDLELQLSNTDDLDEQIRLEKDLLNVYTGERNILEEINALRDETIANGVVALEQLGFNIDYDPDRNKFFVENLEHLNDLVADSKGDYDSLQEATNALRQDTEELIDTLEELNSENQEDADTWQELYHTIREAKVNIVNNLKEIVNEASDAVDSIQNVYDTLKDAADEYAANGGFISVDAFQSIVDLGPEYMQYLRDENGLLIINEEAIHRVIAAKTEQLALENSMSYVERIRLALQADSVESLNTLLYATTEASDATWGLVYAELALMHQTGDLNDSQYEAALHNINAIRSLAESAIQGIGKTANTTEDTLNEMKSGLDDILKYVMDMLRDRIERQIDALEEMKEAYGELIDLKKESMEAAKEETDYQDKVADKVKEIAKLQERINALSLDDSRDAQAQKAELEEEMADLQKELADTQADYAMDTQKDSLDKMQEAYEKEKDKEIAILEESISSEQKLYEMAIAYIQSNWDTLYSELIAWNTEYGSVLNSEITTAWENCLAAAKRYGSYVSALSSIDADIESASGSSGNNTIVGGSGKYDTSSSREESIHAIIKEMYANSRKHGSEDAAGQLYLNRRNLTLGAMLAQYGITAVRGDDGVWYVNRVGGELLYEKYKKYIYHKGGIVGDEGTLKENELLAKLERGEVMVSNHGKGELFQLIEFMDLLSKKIDAAGFDSAPRPVIDRERPDLSSITQNESIHFGDVYIYGADEKTVEKHREVNREFVNDVLRQMNIKR